MKTMTSSRSPTTRSRRRVARAVSRSWSRYHKTIIKRRDVELVEVPSRRRRCGVYAGRDGDRPLDQPQCDAPRDRAGGDTTGQAPTVAALHSGEQRRSTRGGDRLGPLSGIRVVDLSHVLNGPYCTMLLGFLGAEVIKIEQREGDRYRHAWLPMDAKRDGYGFLATNTNKKGITLNLKTERGRELLLALVDVADVLVENFSPGVLDRLGLAPDVLMARNPRLICARSSGYGYSGPYMNIRSNADTNMAITGWQHAAQERAGKPGMKVLGIGDQASGVSMAVGVCAALYERERSGVGQVIEVSMQEALLGFMTQVFHTHFEGRSVGQPPKQCLDGYYTFHLPDISDELWKRLCAAMGEPELGTDARFSSPHARRENHEQVEEAVSRWVRNRSRQELWRVLGEIGLSSAPVLSVAEVLEDTHLAERGAFVTVQHPTAGDVQLLAPWIRMSRTAPAIDRPAPLVGQHNEEVFCGLLGLDTDEYAEMVRSGVI